MTLTDELLAASTAYAATFAGGLPGRPSRHVAVVACMDARLDVYRILGLEPGEANVIRNAGGVVTDDTIRSLAISQHRLGTDEVVLIHHTDCGMLTFTDEGFARELFDATGLTPTWTPAPSPISRPTYATRWRECWRAPSCLTSRSVASCSTSRPVSWARSCRRKE